jgi:glycosyltransferase involved in cell wall biosynthesis
MKVLKLSEYVYAASFSIVHPTYLEGFPQREKYLFGDMPDLEMGWFKHAPLDSDEAITHATAELRKYVEDFQPDFILFDNPISALIVDDELSSISVFDCCDWYLDYYECEFGRDEGYARLKSALEKAMHQTPFCIFQSTTIRDWYRDHPRLALKSEIVLPNGFDDSIFFPGKSALSFDKKTVLFAGKLGKWYGGLRTVAQALPQGWQLMLVGDGPIRDQLEPLDNVVCLGRKPLGEVGDYIRAADVCVMPVNDCSPIATSEYMACGKPVVHEGDKIAWFIRDGENGFLAKQSVDDWRQALMRAASAGEHVRQNALATPKSWKVLQGELSTFLGELQ